MPDFNSPLIYLEKFITVGGGGVDHILIIHILIDHFLIDHFLINHFLIGGTPLRIFSWPFGGIGRIYTWLSGFGATF